MGKSFILLLAVLLIVVQGLTSFRTRRRRVCDELVKFTPNICKSPQAKVVCTEYCNNGHQSNKVMQCGKRTLAMVSDKFLKRYFSKTKKGDVIPPLPEAIIKLKHKNWKQEIKLALRRNIVDVLWPWRVIVLIGVPGNNKNAVNLFRICSGAILSKYFVLSDSKCIHNRFSNFWSVISGSFGTSLNKLWFAQKKFGNSAAGLMKKYRNIKKIYRNNNIVLLQLKQPLDILDEYPEARICLPVSKNTASQSTDCFAVGVDTKVTNQPVRVQTKVERLSKIACDLLYNGKYDNSKQCYAPKIKSQDLKGETFSGMLTCKNAGRWYHGGIHIKRGERRLAMFEDLAKSKNWIIQTILEKSLFKSFNSSLPLAH